jgi:hypothetical protein
MTTEKQIQVYNELDAKILEVTGTKRHDYADTDVLSNFKGVSQAAKSLGLQIGDPTQYALFMVILKIARLSNLMNAGKAPKNESVEDSFLDGINYFKLAYCCYLDKKLDMYPEEEIPF